MNEIGNNSPTGPFDPAHLRDEEQRILTAVKGGKWINFTDKDATPKATVRAEFIRHLMLQLPGAQGAPWPVAPGGIRVQAGIENEGLRVTGARIEGKLDLSDGRSPAGGAMPVLALEYCEFAEPINLEHAWLQRLSLLGSRLNRLSARGIRIDGPCYLEWVQPVESNEFPEEATADLVGAQIEGDLYLNGARFVGSQQQNAKSNKAFWLNAAVIKGNIEFSAAQFLNPTMDALICANITVGGDCLLDDSFKADGAVNFSGGNIRGDFRAGGAEFKNPKEDALNCTGLAIGGSCILGYDFRADGEVSLHSATIKGNLTATRGNFINPERNALLCTNINIGGDCFFDHGLKVEGGVNLAGAVIKGDFDARGSQFINPRNEALILTTAQIGGDCVMAHGFRAEGAVSIHGANILGNMSAVDGHFINPEEAALVATNVIVGGDFFLTKGFKAEGSVDLPGATVKGELNAYGGSFVNPGNDALYAFTATIEGGCYLTDGFHAEGTVSFIGATIKRIFLAAGGHFINPAGTALTAESAIVEGPCGLSNGFHAEGEVCLDGAFIKEMLTLEQGQFLNEGGSAFSARNLTVGSDCVLTEAQIEGETDLCGAQIGQALKVGLTASSKPNWLLNHASAKRLEDNDGDGWGGKCLIVADGLRYQYLDIRTPSKAWTSRRKWLKNNLEWNPDLGPQPYEQVSRVLTSMGHDGAARAALVYSSWRDTFSNLKPPLNPIRFLAWFLWSLPPLILRVIFGFFFSFGYSPGRALATVAVLIGIGTFGADYALKHHLLAVETSPVTGFVIPKTGQFVAPFVAAGSDGNIACTSKDITPLWYAVDTFVPIVQLGQESKCEPQAVETVKNPVWMGREWPVYDDWFLRSLKAVYALLGAVTVSLMVLTFSGTLRKKLED